MKNKLLQSYLYPGSNLYLFLNFLSNRAGLKIFILFFCLSFYPMIYSGYLFYQYNEKIDMLGEEKRLVVRQQHQLTLLKGKNSLPQEKALTEVNQLINKTVQQHKGQIESIQWGLEKEKTIYLLVSQQTPAILAIIRSLNELNLFNFSEINLIKLNRENFIQLNAVLTLKKPEE